MVRVGRKKKGSLSSCESRSGQRETVRRHSDIYEGLRQRNGDGNKMSFVCDDLIQKKGVSHIDRGQGF
jgi:hypothetical protein